MCLYFCPATDVRAARPLELDSVWLIMNETGYILKLRCLKCHKKAKFKNTILTAVSSNEFPDSLWKPVVRNFRGRKEVVNLFSENLGRA